MGNKKNYSSKKCGPLCDKKKRRHYVYNENGNAVSEAALAGFFLYIYMYKKNTP